MGILDTARSLAGVIAATGNVELMRLNVELSTQITDLLQTTIKQDAEIRQLRDRNATHAALTFRENTYWRGEDGPFCSRCWDADDKLARLHRANRGVSFCPVCKTSVIDPNAPPPAPVKRTVQSAYLRRS